MAVPAADGVRVHRVTVLTTNDMRVLRALVAGPLTDAALRDRLARQPLGAEVALRRVPGLVVRASERLDISVAGVRALRAADLAAYGRWA